MDEGGEQEIEWIAPEGDDVDAEEVEPLVQRMLSRDDARILGVVANVLMALGVVVTIGWFVFAWRIEEELSPGRTLGFGDGGADPDLIDRVVALVQISSIALLAAMTIGIGGVLRLFAGRVLGERLDDA